MCKRTTPDPLLRLFLDRYGLHLLAVPRAGVSVGDVYASDGKRTSPVGNVQHLVQPPLRLAAQTDEPMADVAGRFTREVGLDAGLGVLEAFLVAVGAASIVDSVKVHYTRSSARSLTFSFEDPRRDHVDVLEVGAALAGSRFGGQVFGPGPHRFYVATAVARSRSLSVQGISEGHIAVDVGAGLVQVAEADAAVDVRRHEDGRITYAGQSLLAFGLELFEVVPDQESGELRLAMPHHPVPVRGTDPGSRPPRAMLGDPMGELLLAVN